MYYHIKDRRWFENRKQAKEHYGVACFRKLLHLKEIIFTNNQNSIANDELYLNSATLSWVQVINATFKEKD